MMYYPIDMNNEKLAVWLSNHPQLRGADYQYDIKKLIGILYNHDIVYIGTLSLFILKLI